MHPPCDLTAELRGDFFDPGQTFGQHLCRDALRHEVDVRAIDFGIADQVVFDFGDVFAMVDDELDLVGMSFNQLMDDRRLIAAGIVTVRPLGIVDRYGVRKFGADRHQVGMHVAENRACGLDGDDLAVGVQTLGEGFDLVTEHRFAAGNDDVFTVELSDVFQDLIDGHFLTFRIPGGVRRIAEPAAQIAATGANEDRGDPDPFAFALG